MSTYTPKIAIEPELHRRLKATAATYGVFIQDLTSSLIDAGLEQMARGELSAVEGPVLSAPDGISEPETQEEEAS